MIKRIFVISVAIVSLFSIFPVSVFAHPGRTDERGCHVCRKNCIQWGLSNGQYHCHDNTEAKGARNESRQSANVQIKNNSRL